MLAIVSAKTNRSELESIRNFVVKRLPAIAAKRPTRVKRWNEVLETINSKLAAAPVAQPKAVATFTAKPLPKAKAKAKKATVAKVNPLAQALDAFGGDKEALIRALLAS